MAHAYGLDVNDASVMAAFCDYDRDGWPRRLHPDEPARLPSHPNGQRNYLFHNNGDGTFTDVTERAGISGEAQGHSAVWWDYDNDGWPDLYVANDFAAPDALPQQPGRDVHRRDRPRRPAHAVFLDGLGPGRREQRRAGRPHRRRHGRHHPREGPARHGRLARSRTTEDDRTPTTRAPVRANALYINTGTGRCLEAAFLAGLAATDWTWSPRFEDLDNDGRLDLFVTNGMYRERTTSTSSRGRPRRPRRERIRIMREPGLRRAHLAFRNLGDLRFEDVSAAWGLDQKGVSFGAAFGDLTATATSTSSTPTTRAASPSCATTTTRATASIVALRGTRLQPLRRSAPPSGRERARACRSRPLVLARGYLSSSEPILHFGLGADTVITRMTVSWPSGHVQVFENLAADRRFTVTEPSGARPRRAEPEPPGRRQFGGLPVRNLSLASREDAVDETAVQPLLPMRLNRRGPALAVGDVAGTGATPSWSAARRSTRPDPPATGRGYTPRPTACLPRASPSTTGRSSSSTPRATGRERPPGHRGGNACRRAPRNTSRGSSSTTAAAASGRAPERFRRSR
jgi:enediyne biosynthesis protein E4